LAAGLGGITSSGPNCPRTTTAKLPIAPKKGFSTGGQYPPQSREGAFPTAYEVHDYPRYHFGTGDGGLAFFFRHNLNLAIPQQNRYTCHVKGPGFSLILPALSLTCMGGEGPVRVRFPSDDNPRGGGEGEELAWRKSEQAGRRAGGMDRGGMWC